MAKSKMDRLVYAGRVPLNGGGNGQRYFYIINDKVCDELLFKGSDNGCWLGSVYDVPKNDNGWAFGKKIHLQGEDSRYKDKDKYIAEWRAVQAMITELSKEKSSKAEAKKLGNMTLDEIKTSTKYMKTTERKAVMRAAMLYLM